MTQPPPYDDGFFTPRSGGIATPSATPGATPGAPRWPQPGLQPGIWPASSPGYRPPPPPPPAPRRSPALWVVAALVVVVACVAAVVVVAHPKSKASGALDPGCNPKPPSGASTAARQFLAATAAADVYWAAIGRSFAAHNGEVQRNDLAAQVSADNGFLTSLAAISYPVAAQSDAALLQQVIRQYDAELTTAYNQDGYLAAHSAEVFALDNQRAVTSGGLRQDLGLGNTSCHVNRP